MKKLLSLTLTLLLVMSAFIILPTSAQAYKTAKKFNYYIENDKVNICEYLGKSKKVSVPSKIEGLPVVSFGRYKYEEDTDWFFGGFRKNKYVKEITFPKTIKTIQPFSVSYCKNLEKVTIKGKVKTIYEKTFLNCPKLKKVSLPDSVEIIENESFENTGLSGTFTIGKKVKEFYGDVLAGTKVNKISVKKGNKHFSTKNGVLYNKKKTKLICYPCAKKQKSFTTPKSTSSIKFLSFYGVKNLKSITFSKGVKRIDYNVLCDCPKLTKIVFDTNKKLTIDELAVWCPKLTKVVFKTKKNVKIENNAFYSCPKLKTVTLPKNITKIGKHAFGYKHKKSEWWKDMRIKGFTIRGYKGSAAEKYAKKNKFKFVKIG